MKRLFKSEFIRFSSILISGTVIAQLIPIILSPILTRQYSPTEFGLFANFMAIIGVLTPIATGKYESAIMLTRHTTEATDVLSSISILSLLISAFIFIVLVIISLLFPNIEIIGQQKIWILLIPLVLFITALQQITIQFLIKNNKYTRIAKSKIIQGFLSTLIPIALYLIGNTYLWLIAGVAIGGFLSTMYLLKRVPLTLININKFKTILSHYKNLPKHLLPTELLNNGSRQSIFFLITILFDPVNAGIYFMTQRIIITPASLIGNSVGQVFYKKFSSTFLNKSSNPQNLLLKTWLGLAIIGLLPFAILYFYGSQIFTYFFGIEWSKSGELASILTIYFYASFISSPTSSAIITLNLTHLSLYFGIYSFIIRPLSLLIGYFFNDIFLSFKILCLLEISQILIYNHIIWKNSCLSP